MRGRSKSYRVVNLQNGDVWDFATAEQAALHLWGKWPLSDYAIFKHGVRWRWRRALEKWQPETDDRII